jgi:hypothetical protein
MEKLPYIYEINTLWCAISIHGWKTVLLLQQCIMLYCVAKILLCDTDKDSGSKKGDIINGTSTKRRLTKRHHHKTSPN